MDKPAEQRQFAWQPLTVRGVAAFALASFSRLLLVQLIFALLAAASVIWFLHRAWFPMISNAIAVSPAQSEIRHGTLKWTGTSPQCLAENRFLSLSVDLRHEGQARSPAHVQLEFGETTVKIFSLLGFVEMRYPAGWHVGLERSEAQPWWGAWNPAILAIAGASTVAALMICWALLATIYFVPAWVIAFFANRALTFGGGWRLAAAALLPGALFLTAGVVVYGGGLLDLPTLGLFVAAHILVGWVYLVWAIWVLPRDSGNTPANTNPFVARDTKGG